MMKKMRIRTYLVIIVYIYKNIIAGTLDCNFDADFCNWQHDDMDDFNWERESYDTKSPSTGPTSDHTTGNGHYIYIEASSKDKGEKSRIISSVQSPGQYCLTFWYSMYGRYIGTLNVYLVMNGKESLIFTKNKDTGIPDWWKSVLNSKANESYEILFEGIIGDDYRGDIAIDDISYKSGFCSIDCDFDDDFCNWMQYDEDNFDWKRQKGETETSSTGPTADHTSGHGHYIYIDSSNQYRGDTAGILSPYLDAGKYCVSFWYYMYGRHIDRLRLQSWLTNGSKQTLRSIESAQGPQWFHNMITLSSRKMFQIAFEGRVRDALYRSRGDIAIDDVALFTCHDCNDPTPNHGLANSSNYEYGSVVKLQCNHGYSLKGDSVIVCEAMERWNGSAECIPYDCGNLTIQNGTFKTPNGTTFGQVGRLECGAGFDSIGEQNISCTVIGWSSTSAYCKLFDCGNLTIKNGTFITPNGTTFGQVGRQVCDTGFDLIGERNIRCTVNGWSKSSAYCQIIDCGNLTIQNGTFITPEGTTFGHVGRQVCDTGFDLIGEQKIGCTVNGWSNTSAYCQIVDCGNLTIQNGTFTTPEGTTFGHVGRQVCDTGFDLIGEHNIRCTEKGWSNTSSYCKITDSEYLEKNDSPLVAVYVLPPVVIVLIVAAVITVMYIRRRDQHCLKIFKTVHKTRNAPSEVSINGQSRPYQMYNNEAVRLDDEYATIVEEQNKYDVLDTVYFANNTDQITKEPDKKQTKVANCSAEERNRNGLNRYDVSHTEELNSRIENNEEQDANYDHACTGKMNTKSSNRDDYSHFGDLEAEYQHTLNFDKQADMQENTDYSHIDRVNTNKRFPKHFERKNQNFNDYQNATVKDKKVAEEHTPKFEHPDDQAVEYYNVETNVEDTDNKSCFMIEENEQKYESDGLENHEYFILEKT